MIANLPYEPTGDAVAPGPWAQAPRQPQVNADANVVNGVAMLLDDAGADFPPGLRAGRPLDRQRRTRELVKLVGMILGFMPMPVMRDGGRPATAHRGRQVHGRAGPPLAQPAGHRGSHQRIPARDRSHIRSME
jgi:hypothetical protein